MTCAPSNQSAILHNADAALEIVAAYSSLFEDETVSKKDRKKTERQGAELTATVSLTVVAVSAPSRQRL